MRIALLDVARAQQARLAGLLDFPHELVGPTSTCQSVDAVVALRFGTAEAERFSTRLLHLPGAGADAVDLLALPPGCQVCNVYEHEIPIAEYVLAAMLEHTLGLARMRAAFDATRWSETYAARRTHGEIQGKTLGVIGFGHIGQAVAQRARALGLRVHAISRGGQAPGVDWAGTVSQLPQMLPEVDFLLIACPLTPETRGLIGAAQLQLMKPSAVLINIGRAHVVEEEALYRALESGALGGAALDVWYEYPVAGRADVRPARFAFEQLPNVHCTAHSSAWTEELFERRYAFIADNLSRLNQGLPLRNVIHTGL